MYKFNLLILKKVFKFYFKRFYFAIFLFFICFGVLDLYLRNNITNSDILKEVEIKFDFSNGNKSSADFASFYNFNVLIREKESDSSFKEARDRFLDVSKKIEANIKSAILEFLQSSSRIKVENFDLVNQISKFRTLSGSEFNSISNDEVTKLLYKDFDSVSKVIVDNFQNELKDLKFFSTQALLFINAEDNDAEKRAKLNKNLLILDAAFEKSNQAIKYFLKSKNILSIKINETTFAPGNYWVLLLSSFFLMNILYLIIIYIFYFFRTNEKKII